MEATPGVYKGYEPGLFLNIENSTCKWNLLRDTRDDG
jgi:hypothetical protein